jgi:hypothetical protein
LSKSRDLEILVQKIQAQLAPDAEVLHDVRLEGKQSKTSRQIDVLVRQKIGQYEMLIVIDCKDHARPVDVTGVEAFHEFLNDVGAHRGALVSPKGFTASAKTRAMGFQIDLYSPVDTDPHKWQARVSAPMLCDFRSALISFGLSSSAPMPIMLKPDFFRADIVRDDQGNILGTAFDAAIEKWETGKFPVEAGEHKDLAIFGDKKVTIDNGYGTQVPVDLTASLIVRRQLYFGYIPIAKISGFKDELSGGIITNAFTTGIFDLDDVMTKWEKIKSESDLPMPVMLRLQGLVGWSSIDRSL